MAEYIIKEPFTVEVTKTNYALDVATDKYVLTKVCEYGERLSLERIVRCKDCKRLIQKGEEFFIDCNKAERDACRLFSEHDMDYDWTSFFYVRPDGFCAWGERRAVE